MAERHEIKVEIPPKVMQELCRLGEAINDSFRNVYGCESTDPAEWDRLAAKSSEEIRDALLTAYALGARTVMQAK